MGCFGNILSEDAGERNGDGEVMVGGWVTR